MVSGSPKAVAGAQSTSTPDVRRTGLLIAGLVGPGGRLCSSHQHEPQNRLVLPPLKRGTG